MKRITVRFHGDLKQFGDNFKLRADSANDAIHSLMCQIEGLRKHIRNGWYELRVGNKVRSEEDLKKGIHLKDSDIVHLTPRAQGAGKWGMVIVGAIIAVVGIFTYNPALIQAGVGIALGGVAQMLVKQPSFNNDLKGVEDSKGSAFSNLSNMVGQGKQVPRVYGEMVVGSVVISQDMSSYRPDSGTKINDVETPIYTKSRINVIKAKDANGNYFNTDTNDESVRDAAVNIKTEWK